MANKIIESRLIPFNVQKGDGTPTHISPSGTLFFDSVSGVTYQNIDGLSNWSALFGSTNKPQDIYVTGGTYDWTTGVATFRNNAGGSFTLFGFNVSSGGSGVFTGGTIVGAANFLAGLTSTTITSTSVSATTYYNLPKDIFVTGGTYLNGTTTFTNNTGGTFNVTGFTTIGALGNYLPLSGGTMTGGLVANSGVTASTISQTTYIDFTTGSTNPSAVGGRVFFDNATKALSYYDVLGNNVPIAMGQQLYTRVRNVTGSQIDKGKVIAITGTSNGYPSAILATNNHNITSARPIGLAAENIANNTEGLVLNNGILSGITLNTFSNGDNLYLSDTVAGGYVSSTSSLAYTARTNEIGYVIQTGSTTGKIYVRINNEDSNLSLTDIERNILEGNVISTGTYQYTGMTQGTGQTINVALVRGWVVQNTNGYATLPDVININYTGGTNIPLSYLNSADATYILVNSASTLVQQTTFPTPQERRQNIYLGKVVHPNRTTITSLNQTVDFDVSPMSAIRDLWTPIKLINQGLTVSPNGVNLSINVSSGTLWGNGIGWVTNQLNPDSVVMSGTSPTTFQYRSQLGPVTGATPLYTGNTTFVDTTNYDVGGVVTNVPGAGSFTTQRIYKFPTGLVIIQYAQTYYSTMAKALAELQNETFIEYANNRDNGILIGMLTVKNGTTDLTNTDHAIFHVVSKFGELAGGSAGYATTTLQQAYNNSTSPEIVINATLDGLTIQNGTGNPDAITHLLEGQNTAGSTTSFITAGGGFSGSSVSALTITTPSVTANANGLTASTISATTYYNLPTYIRTTGATYSNNTFTFTNNTGGTYSVLFNIMSGLTVNGNLTVTGNTSLQGLTATTISATTYYNLPTDIRTTGATYSNNTFTFTNNTGGTFNVLFNTVTGFTVNGNLIVTGTTSSTTFSGSSLTLSNSASTISLNNTTQQQIRFFSGGTGVPTYNTYSTGAKIIFSDNISSISSGYAIGVDAGSLWYGADLAGNGHDWYAGTRKLASLIGSAGFQLIGLGGPTTTAMVISGTSATGSKGGAGYMDFLKVVNNYSGATNPNKWFRVNSTGGLEILNSVYTATTLTISDNGIVGIGTATSSSSDGTSNYLSFNNNNSQIYDDGNFHIHSRGANQAMWINTNSGQINIGVQSPTASGGIASAVAFGTGTVNGYVTINTGRTVTTSANYGYLTTGGAGTYGGGSQSVVISLYANNRIWGQEIDAFSDERMKNIQGEIKLEDGIKLVNNLKPIKYTWKEGDDKGVKAGYSAQQVIKSGFDHLIGLIPTEGLEERIDDDGFVSPKDTQFAMNYDQVTPYHGVVIKHLLEKIDELQKQIDELKSK